VCREDPLIQSLRHLHGRELGFLGLVALTALLIGLHLAGSGLGRVELPGGGWRAIDRSALERRIEQGDLRDREAEWFRPASLGEGTGADSPARGRP
jgi:hypothetical protein